MAKEFFDDKYLTDAGFYSRAHRARLIKAGKIPPPIQVSGKGGKRLYTQEHIDAIKGLKPRGA